MFSERYKGLRIAVSHAAMRELMKHEKTLADVVEILETGIDAPRKRKQGTIEKWHSKGNKTWNALIVMDYTKPQVEFRTILLRFMYHETATVMKSTCGRVYSATFANSSSPRSSPSPLT